MVVVKVVAVVIVVVVVSSDGGCDCSSGVDSSGSKTSDINCG